MDIKFRGSKESDLKAPKMLYEYNECSINFYVFLKKFCDSKYYNRFEITPLLWKYFFIVFLLLWN